MASKKQLVQIDKTVQASLLQPDTGFVGFGAKTDGLYQRRNGHAEEKLAIEKVVVIYQSAHGFAVGNAIKLSGSTWVKARADSAANAGTVGIVSEIVDVNNFKYITTGILPGLYTSGANYFLSPTTAGVVFIQSDPEEWGIGEVREFIGVGTTNGLDINIDIGQEITEMTVPVSIWDLTDIDRTGWAAGKVVKFDANGNLVAGIDLQGLGESITLADLSAIGAIAYNSVTGVFSIASGYSVPTTAEKGNYNTAFNWGNHANAGYLTAITKALVESVLTGIIGSHSHDYDKYVGWRINDDHLNSANVASQTNVFFSNGNGVEHTLSIVGNVCTITASLNINNLTNIVNPSLNHYIAIQSGSLVSRISLSQLATLIGGGGGGGGVTDHGALTGLTDDDHTQYYNQTRGDAKYAQKAGSSSQSFATANLSTNGTIVASGTITGSEVYRGSARKLKMNIRPLNIDALPIIDSVLICEYDLRKSGEHYIGFIADDTHELLSGDGKDKHNFGNHLALLTKAMQEQNKQIADLKNELHELRTLLNTQKNAGR